MYLHKLRVIACIKSRRTLLPKCMSPDTLGTDEKHTTRLCEFTQRKHHQFIIGETTCPFLCQYGGRISHYPLQQYSELENPMAQTTLLKVQFETSPCNSVACNNLIYGKFGQVLACIQYCFYVSILQKKVPYNSLQKKNMFSY